MKKIFTFAAAALVALSANAVDYYLIGGFNGWSTSDPDCLFTPGSNGEYVLDLPANKPLTSGFKINDGTWSNDNENYGAGGALTPGEVYNLTVGGSSGNIEFVDKATTIPSAHLVFNPAEKTLVVTGKSEAATIIYGIHGNFAGGDSWNTHNMVESNGKWVLSNQTVVDSQFGIKAMNSLTQAQTDWFAAASPESATVVLNTPISCSNVDATNFSISAGTYNFTFDPTALTLTVTEGEGGGDIPTPGPGDTDYSDWWVNVGGPFNDNDFYNGGVQPVNGVAKFELLAIGDQGFKVKTWDGATDVYYVADTETVPADKWVQLYVDGYDVTMTIEGATAGEMFYLWFNVTNNQMMVSTNPNAGDTTEGIDGITIENGEAQYFNLQGVRVANPEKGIFVRVQNGKAVKVVK